MKTRLVASLQTALIIPAMLFLTSVLVGTGDPPQYELAHVAQRIAASYAGRTWGLFLVVLPVAALVTGCVTLVHGWHAEGELRIGNGHPSLAAIPAPFATLVIGWATITSVGLLAVVALHMLAN